MIEINFKSITLNRIKAFNIIQTIHLLKKISYKKKFYL